MPKKPHPDALWIPPLADQEAARLFRGLDPVERLLAIRRMCRKVIYSASFDPHEIAFARLLLRAALDHDPARVFSDGAMADGRGSHGMTKVMDRFERDRGLRNVAANPPFRGKASIAIARDLIAEFARYEKNQWKRDRQSGKAPEVEPHKTFFRMLCIDIAMPKTARHLAAILDREIK